MSKFKPGIILRFLICWRIERLTAGELEMQTYLKEILDELLMLKPGPKTNTRIDFLFQESNKVTSQIKILQDKKKNLYLKMI